MITCVVITQKDCFVPNRNLAMNQLSDFPDLSANIALQEL